MKGSIYHVCPPCGGTGVEIITIPQGEGTVTQEIVCRTCGGSGVVSNQFLSDDLIDQLDDMQNKINDIKQKVDEIKTKVDTL